MTKPKKPDSNKRTKNKEYIGLAVVQPHIYDYNPETLTNSFLYVIFYDSEQLADYLRKATPVNRGIPVIGSHYVTKIPEEMWRKLKNQANGLVFEVKGPKSTHPTKFIP